jgi:hypothetical protein
MGEAKRRKEAKIININGLEYSLCDYRNYDDVFMGHINSFVTARDSGVRKKCHEIINGLFNDKTIVTVEIEWIGGNKGVFELFKLKESIGIFSSEKYGEACYYYQFRDGFERILYPYPKQFSVSELLEIKSIQTISEKQNGLYSNNFRLNT